MIVYSLKPDTFKLAAHVHHIEPEHDYGTTTGHAFGYNWFKAALEFLLGGKIERLFPGKAIGVLRQGEFDEGVVLASSRIRVDSCGCSCIPRGMKTVTLDDVAYARLKALKRGPNESFSSVVKRVLPVPGTLSDLVAFAETHGTSRLAGNDLMEASVEERSTVKEDPWS